MKGPRIVLAGDAVVLIEFEERMDPIISATAAAVADAVEAARIPAVRDVVPTYRSVAVYFDPLETDHATLTSTLQALADHSSPQRSPARVASHEVPVCYGGDLGPDLANVAAFGGLTEADVIALHSGMTYRVYMIGFMPGFAYMGTVDPQIAPPRLDKPRTRVPRGSVGIAQRQTGIYPSDGPGGWPLIGRTTVRPFDLSRAEPFLFRVGDDVRFVPIGREEFERLDRAR
jgi:inhibitor of KinA